MFCVCFSYNNADLFILVQKWEKWSAFIRRRCATLNRNGWMCGKDVWSGTAAVSTATRQTLLGLESVWERLKLADLCPTGVQTVSGKRTWAPLFLRSCLFWKALVVPVMGSASIQHQQSNFKRNWNPVSTMLWYSQTSLMSFLTCHEPAHCWENWNLTNTVQDYTQICKQYREKVFGLSDFLCFFTLFMIVLFVECSVVSREKEKLKERILIQLCSLK